MISSQLQPLGKVLFQVCTGTPLAGDSRGYDADDEQDEGCRKAARGSFLRTGSRSWERANRSRSWVVSVGEYRRRIVDSEGLRVAAHRLAELRHALLLARLLLLLAVFAILDVEHERLAECVIDLLVDGGEFGVVAGDDARELLRLRVGR